MDDRLLSVRRVLDVQVKLRRIAELKLAELQRQEQVLQARKPNSPGFSAVKARLRACCRPTSCADFGGTA